MTQNDRTGLRLWEGLANGCRASQFCLKLSRRVLKVAGLSFFVCYTHSLVFCQDAAKLMRKTVFEKSSNGRSYDAKCPNGV